jgi:ATP-dependent Clp protease ATP-binding subunit ClpA
MLEGETAKLLRLEEELGKRVVGQKKAVQAVSDAVRRSRAGVADPNRPTGSFMFLGPTGVGKTELAKALAELLFGDEKRMIRIDMSEFQDGSTAIDKLVGVPRGVAGSERGGSLTNQLRDNPYSVVLLDEIEKASPALLNLFLQAFDEGWMTDGRGRRVYLSDAVVIMTSNLGAEHFRKLSSPLGFRSQEATSAAVRADVTRELERRLSPEFRNRIDEVVIFEPLTTGDVAQIARTYLDRVSETMAEQGKHLSVSPEAIDLLVRDGYDAQYGARFLKRVIDDRVKIPISQMWASADTFRVKVVDERVVVEAWPSILSLAPEVALG